MQDATAPGEQELRAALQRELTQLRSQLNDAASWRHRLRLRWRIRNLRKRQFQGEIVRW